MHQKFIKKSSILKINTPDETTVEEHKECARMLEKSVEQMLSRPPNTNPQAQDVLLEEVEEVFTKEDKEMLLKVSTKEEVYKCLCESNLNTSP